MSRKEKQLEEYLLTTTAHQTSIDAYMKCPAEAFLLYVCDAYDTFQHCKNKFTTNKDDSYNKDSEDSLRIISCALLGSLMGHFETYQKALLAGLIEISSVFPNFDAASFAKHHEKHCGGEISIQIIRVLSLRGTNTKVGYVIADALKQWHDPKMVNSFFKSLGLKKEVITTDHASDIQVLWQLRHSVVHTGAWLSLPDSQKVKRLRNFGDKPIVFEHTFINAVGRKLHKIVSKANETILTECLLLLGENPSQDNITKLKVFLEVKSPKTDWLKNPPCPPSPTT